MGPLDMPQCLLGAGGETLDSQMDTLENQHSHKQQYTCKVMLYKW